MVIIMDHGHITPDREHSVLLIIDVQRDFTIKGAVAEIPGTLQSAEYIKRLVQDYRKLGFPTVHVVRI